eukprot:CAMPEP_0206207956 /NCGR_PEP_ID=MMETSP0166-20121206/15916_1 /ASSEMBLY_ACC=CAM_ASM_000260 /TAXON_ID=95228 /ORGANISM="Vannella robusta, Strain DIVA3 518/3/11/1/6" /LENGTH=34 /DNA_ID= /DNA_START= /DNA_END= /DNA_ORIENTATION=
MELDGFPVDLSSWNIGADMGRFAVEENEEIAQTW